MNLPKELIETILTYIVDSYSHDPTYQWTKLRRLSPYQKCRIEKHVHNHWLPKMVISNFATANSTLHYFMDTKIVHDLSLDVRKDIPLKNVVVFRNRESKGPACWWKYNLMQWEQRWQEYDVENPNVVCLLAIGEHRYNGSRDMLISDVELADLVVEPLAAAIHFDWYKTLDNLFWEAMFMRTLRDKWLEELSGQWRLEHNHAGPVPSTVLLELLKKHIQTQRRVVNRQQRTRLRNLKDNTQREPIFHDASARFHRQPPNRMLAKDEHYLWNSPAGRKQPPDIFEITQRLESMVPEIPGSQSLSEDELLELYEEEHKIGMMPIISANAMLKERKGLELVNPMRKNNLRFGWDIPRSFFQ